MQIGTPLETSVIRSLHIRHRHHSTDLPVQCIDVFEQLSCKVVRNFDGRSSTALGQF